MTRSSNKIPIGSKETCQKVIKGISIERTVKFTTEDLSVKMPFYFALLVNSLCLFEP